MPFSLISGRFHVVNYSPDGDSIRFEPEDQSLIRQLVGGSRARFNQRGHVQLRIEAIDTLETHFSPNSGGGALHQPAALARAATDRLLEYLGFDLAQIIWDSQHRNVINATPDSAEGFILARSVEKNGRPVSFVFRGATLPAGGPDNVLLDEALLRRSYNYLALAEGIAYATFYQGLFNDLRDVLSNAAAQARNAQLGVYADDRTNTGFTATGLGIITDDVPIMPKLFRRLSDYLVNTGSASGFKQAMFQVRERVFDLRNQNFTHFDTFIEQNGKDIRLSRFPEELVFDETQPQPGPVLANLLSTSDNTGLLAGDFGIL